MRVALVDPSLFTLPYDAALAAGLGAAGHEVRLYGRRAGPDDNQPDGVALVESFYRLTQRPPLSSLPQKARLGLKGADHLVSMLGLLRRLKREPADVIHFQWLPLPALDRHFLAGLRRIAPLVLTVHDTNPFNGNPAARLQRIGAEAAVTGFDRLIVHTERGRQRLIEQGADAARISVLPHGLLETPAPPIAPDPMDGELTFLLFGKIKPYKGADLLIEAFARLAPPLRERARLLIIGKPYMDIAPLRALAEARGVARQTTIETRFVADPELASLFSPGTIAAFPYREIEASGVLSLAIAHGRPVLASRIGGFAETVEDGLHGLLVPPGDETALAAAMTRLLEDRAFAARCARAVASLARAVPDWTEIARRTAAIYDAAGARES
ncbi:MAG: glycosyltransferase [Acetobacteraceae bacterium]|nr:glycosyltransferase [Acetobacteraceae bacterium]